MEGGDENGAPNLHSEPPSPSDHPISTMSPHPNRTPPPHYEPPIPISAPRPHLSPPVPISAPHPCAPLTPQ